MICLYISPIIVMYSMLHYASNIKIIAIIIVITIHHNQQALF